MNQYKLVCRCDRQTVTFQNWCSNQVLIVVVVIKYKTYCNCLTDFSRSTDRNFHCFAHVKLFYVTHTYQPMGKIKNDQPHAARTSIRVVTMSHLSVFRIFWKPFSCFTILNGVFCGEQEKESIILVRMG